MKTRLSFLLAAGVAALILGAASAPALAWRIVYDPTNHVQNVLQAARALEQISNQITSLQNEAQMLINQARNLASLPYSSLQQLQQSVARTQALLGEAQRVAYDVAEIDQAFTTTYGPANTSQSDQDLITGARERWQTSVAGLQDALKVQATVVGNLDTHREQMSELVTQSQSAVGALQATQAGNQLLALQAQQLADLTATLAAQGRAQALESAQRSAAQEQGREQLRRFLTPGAGYHPGNAAMFHNR
ncbi:MAG TPA: P-type conjugative transfer protein TrbJ [Mesorhizobium sp.]|jgi:P-type conjugative transfer protein TrbJ|nr:P-type conjugative transfer protein TrbJ [Mesorhizobium sp.]